MSSIRRLLLKIPAGLFHEVEQFGIKVLKFLSNFFQKVGDGLWGRGAPKNITPYSHQYTPLRGYMQ